jgi:hypothetical protein
VINRCLTIENNFYKDPTQTKSFVPPITNKHEFITPNERKMKTYGFYPCSSRNQLTKHNAIHEKATPLSCYQNLSQLASINYDLLTKGLRDDNPRPMVLKLG